MIKNASFTKAISSKQCISEYLSLLDKVNDEKFTWTGVKDFSRWILTLTLLEIYLWQKESDLN